MEIVVNRSSGKVFIVLEDAGESEFLGITPEGKIKRLKRELFAVIDSGDLQDAKSGRHPTPKQMEVCANYYGTRASIA